MADDIQSNIKINIDTSQALASIQLLQAQISAFHTQMAKMGAANAAAASNMQQNLLSSINASGKFAASITSIKTSAESFTSALEKNKLSLGEYFRYAGAASKSFGKNFGTEFDTINKVARERVKDLQTQYIKLGRDATGAMQAIKVRPLILDMENMSTKTQIAAQKQQLLNQLLKQGSTNLLNFGKNTQWAGRQLMVGFTVPLTIMGGAAVKAYQQMEEAAVKFKRVYGDMNTTNASTDQMVKQVQRLALEYTKYGIAVKDTMDMAAQAAAMGKTGSDLLQQISSANKLSALGGVDQNKALQTTISLTNAFSISSKDLGKNIDFLNAVENQTVLNIDDMTIAIPKAAPVIKQLGGNVKDLAFFLTAMKEGGINASEGANALKSGLASIINPTNAAKTMLQSLGINITSIVQKDKGNLRKTVLDFAQALDQLDPLQRAQAIEKMFGKFQFARVSTLFQNVTKQGTQAAKVLDLANASSVDLALMSQQELKKVQDSPLFQFKKAMADFQNSLAPIGEQFLKAITPIIRFGQSLLDGFNNLSGGVKQFIIQVVGVGGIIGPVLLMTFGLIANAVANTIKGFSLVKDMFNKTGKSSLSLGEQVNYMTQSQIEAASVASSLEQVHSKLKQSFTAEAVAVNELTAAYERSVAAQRAFGGTPAMPSGPIRGYATGGIIRGPGTGTSDSIPALLSNGEAVIPATQVAKHPQLVKNMIAGNLPKYATGGIIGSILESRQAKLSDKQFGSYVLYNKFNGNRTKTWQPNYDFESAFRKYYEIKQLEYSIPAMEKFISMYKPGMKKEQLIVDMFNSPGGKNLFRRGVPILLGLSGKSKDQQIKRLEDVKQEVSQFYQSKEYAMLKSATGKNATGWLMRQLRSIGKSNNYDAKNIKSIIADKKENIDIRSEVNANSQKIEDAINKGLSPGEIALLKQEALRHRTSSRLKVNALKHPKDSKNKNGRYFGPGMYFAEDPLDSKQLFYDFGNNVYKLNLSDEQKEFVKNSKGYIDEATMIKKAKEYKHLLINRGKKDSSLNVKTINGIFGAQWADPFIQKLMEEGYIGYEHGKAFTDWYVGAKPGYGLEKTKYATGGIFKGPGTGTSDSILARVSNGEAIIPAKSVARNPHLVNQLISGNIPGFAGGYQDPYNLQEKIGLKKADILGKKGADPQVAQIHARDAIEAGHTLASKFKTADEFLIDMETSMKELGHSQSEINSALKETNKKMLEQKEYLKQQGKTEEEIAKYKFQTFNERTVLQPGPVNNKGTGSFLSSEVKNFYKPGKEGSFAFANFTPHLKSMKFTDEEIQQILSKMATNLHTSLSKIDNAAQMTLGDLDKLTNTAIDDAVRNDAKAKKAMYNIDNANFTFKTAKAGDNSRIAVAESYKNKQADRITMLEQIIGQTSPLQTGGRTTFNKKAFEEAGAQYSPRATKNALEYMMRQEGKYLDDANKLIRDYVKRGAAYLPEMFKIIETNLAELGTVTMAEFEKTVALNIGTISTSMIHGIDQGFKNTMQIASPSKKAEQLGKQSGDGLIIGLESAIPKAEVVGQEIGQTITNSAGGSRRVTADSSNSQSSSKSNSTTILMPGEQLPQSNSNNIPASGNFLKRATSKVLGIGTRGSMVGFGLSSVFGMMSSIDGPIGQISGQLSAFSAALSSVTMILPLLGEGAIAAISSFAVAAAPAVIALGLFGGAIYLATKAEEDRLEKLKQTTAGYTASLYGAEQAKASANIFGYTQRSASSSKFAIQGNAATNTKALSEQNTLDKIIKTDDFKNSYKDIVNSTKNISSAAELGNSLYLIGLQNMIEGNSQEGAMALVKAIQKAAGKIDVPLTFKSLSLDTPDGKKQLSTSISQLLNPVNSVKPVVTYRPYIAPGSPTETWRKQVEYTQEDLDKLDVAAKGFKTVFQSLGTAVYDGTISLKTYNSSMDYLFASMKKSPNSAKLFSTVLKKFPSEIQAAFEKIKLGKNVAFEPLLKAAMAGVTVSQSILDDLASGTHGRIKQGLKDLQDTVKAQIQANRELQKILQDNKPQSQKNLDIWNAKIANLNGALDIISRKEAKINKTYDARIKALDDIQKANDSITQQQQDQLDLADALSKGDIAAAAKAQSKMSADAAKASSDAAKASLEQGRQNALSSISITDASGKSYSRTTLESMIAYVQNLIDTQTLSGFNFKNYKTQKATGGHITGPGSGTSDSIPAMLSNGEYVVRANAVKAIGVGTLDKLNQADRIGFKNGGYNGYASGGMVSPLDADNNILSMLAMANRKTGTNPRYVLGGGRGNQTEYIPSGNQIFLSNKQNTLSDLNHEFGHGIDYNLLLNRKDISSNNPIFKPMVGKSIAMPNYDWNGKGLKKIIKFKDFAEEVRAEIWSGALTRLTGKKFNKLKIDNSGVPSKLSGDPLRDSFWSPVYHSDEVYVPGNNDPHANTDVNRYLENAGYSDPVGFMKMLGLNVPKSFRKFKPIKGYPQFKGNPRLAPINLMPYTSKLSKKYPGQGTKDLTKFANGGLVGYADGGFMNTTGYNKGHAKQHSQEAILELSPTDPSAPWNKGGWAQNGNDPVQRKAYWQQWGYKPSYLKKGDPSSADLMGVAKTGAYFIPGISELTNVGDALTAAQSGDIPSAIISGGFAALPFGGNPKLLTKLLLGGSILNSLGNQDFSGAGVNAGLSLLPAGLRKLGGVFGKVGNAVQNTKVFKNIRDYITVANAQIMAKKATKGVPSLQNMVYSKDYVPPTRTDLFDFRDQYEGVQKHFQDIFSNVNLGKEFKSTTNVLGLERHNPSQTFSMNIGGDFYKNVIEEGRFKRKYGGNYRASIISSTKEPMSARVGLIQLEDSFKGKGIAKNFTIQTQAILKKLGVSRINMTAGLSDGGYAWAKAGFKFSSSGDLVPRLTEAEKLFPENKQISTLLHKMLTLRPTDRGYPSPKDFFKIKGKVSADLFDEIMQHKQELHDNDYAQGETAEPFVYPKYSPKIGDLIMRGSSWEGYKDLNRPSMIAPVGKALVKFGSLSSDMFGRIKSKFKPFIRTDEEIDEMKYPTFAIKGKRFAFQGFKEDLSNLENLGVTPIPMTSKITTRTVPSRYIHRDTLVQHKEEPRPYNFYLPNDLMSAPGPTGLLKTALKLKPNNKKLLRMLTNFESMKIGKKETRLLDDMTASMYFGKKDADEVNGLAMTLSGLTGNKVAKTMLRSSRSKFYKYTKDKQASIWQKTKYDWSQKHFDFLHDVIPANPNKITAIHSTKYPVNRNEKGKLELYPHGHYPSTHGRTSLHFTLEDVVKSHFFGKWNPDETKIITPLSSIMKRKGKPSGFLTNDTWFDFNPGEKLNLDNAAVIRPYTNRKDYIKELSNRGLLTKDMIENSSKIPLIMDDLKTKEVLHLTNNFNTVEKARIFKEILGRNYVNKKGLDEKFPDQESVNRVLEIEAIQRAKKMVGIDTQHSPHDSNGLYGNSLDKIKSFAKLLNLRERKHMDSDEEILENPKNKEPSIFENMQAQRFARLKGIFNSGIKRIYKDNGLDFAHGGLVQPKYFAKGGHVRGTDTVPAMLTPGEFVIKKKAVDRVGASTLNKINEMSGANHAGTTSAALGDSVYNTYSINISVNSNSNPQDIANTVLNSIRRIDSQRIRSNRI